MSDTEETIARDCVREDDYVRLSSKIVSAFVSNNAVPTADLGRLIATVHGALVALTSVGGWVEAAGPVGPLTPAVPVKKSVTADHIICLEDGRTFKSLKRHLRAKYDMSPEQYRAKWGLPPDYPMVAPNYAKARSDLAKAIGLGVASGRSAAPSALAA